MAGQGQVDDVVVEFPIRRGTEVVFDIAGPLDFVRFEIASLKLVEDRLERLAHDICQDVEPAPMRHADDDFANSQRAAALDDLFHRRNQGFPAVEAESLCAGVLDVEKFLEFLGLNQLVENGLAPPLGEGDFLPVALDPVP